MAKSIDPKIVPTIETNPRGMDSSGDDDVFLRSLSQKHGAALHLSNELAAWFGDHRYSQPIPAE
jgi:hypothetical protein